MSEEKTPEKIPGTGPVELSREDLKDSIEAMREVSNWKDKFEKGLESIETVKGEMTELVKTAIDKQKEADAKAREKQINHATQTATSDKCIDALREAVKMPASEARDEALAQAMARPSKDELVEDFKEASDELYFVDTIKQSSRSYQNRGGMRSLKAFEKFQNLKERVYSEKAVAPMDTTDTTDWVPTGMSSRLVALPRLYGRLEPLFEHIYCPTKVYDLPVNLNGPDVVADYIAEATTNTDNPGDTYGQTITDGKVTFTAKKLRSRIITSAELTEDAIVSMIPLINGELQGILASTVEACILNGDTTATHQDTDIEALGANDGRTAWKGLRKLALAGSLTHDASATNITDAALLATKAKAGKYAVNPNDGVWIMGIIGYVNQMCKLTNVVTVDKYGPAATVITGEVAKYHGSPVIVSEHQREDLNAAGVDDGVTATESVFMYVNHRYFYIGDRRLLTLDSERWITTDQINLVCFRRLDFEPFQAPDSTYSLLGMAYNSTSAA